MQETLAVPCVLRTETLHSDTEHQFMVVLHRSVMHCKVWCPIVGRTYLTDKHRRSSNNNQCTTQNQVSIVLDAIFVLVDQDKDTAEYRTNQPTPSEQICRGMIALSLSSLLVVPCDPEKIELIDLLKSLVGVPLPP